MSQSANARRAIKDITNDIKKVFKKYSRSARRDAWDGITSKAGDKLVGQLINNPSKPVVGIERLLRFKEWLEIQESD